MQSFCPNNLPLKFDEAYFSNRMAMYCLQCFAVKLNVFNHSVAHTKSLYISHAVSNFYGTEMEIWAGFGPVDITEKKNLGLS